MTESSTLLSCLIRASRAFASVLPLSPNRRSNTTRGLFSVGSGVFALRHEMVVVYAQAKAHAAAAGGSARFDGELERGELRVPACVLRDDLVQRNAGVEKGL